MAESVYAQHKVARVNRAAHDSVRKLSSGSRISRAADAAADLGISEKMRAHVKSMHAAQRNIQDAISMLNVADGTLDEVGERVSRMRELAIQSASDVLSNTEREYVSDEYRDIIEDIDRITRVAEFNGLKVTPGSPTAVSVQIGIKGDDLMENTLRLRLYPAGTGPGGLGVGLTRVDTAANAQMALKRLDDALDLVNRHRASHGAAQNQLGAAYKSLETLTENTVEAESRIRDTDIAFEAANLTRQQVFRQVGVAMLSQANSSSQAALGLLL